MSTAQLTSLLAICLASCLCLNGCPGSPAGKEAGHAGESAEEHAAHAEHGDEEETSGHAEHDEGAPGHAEHNEGAEGHDEHGHEEAGGGHEGHDHAELVSLSPEQLEEYGVEVATATGGRLEQYLTLPGEAAVNADKVGHVLPKLPGVIKSVHANIGDNVKKGQLLAVVESRELAEAKADYIGARERLSIAKAASDREKGLFEKGISPEQDYIDAQNRVREAEIDVRAAEQSLSALGVGAGELQKLVEKPGGGLTRYEVYAPTSGRVLEKHVAVGEMVDSATELFLIADLSSVWINLNVSQKDLPLVTEGQQVRIRFSPTTGSEPLEQPADNPGIPDAEGSIRYIDALVSEDTRTAQARLVLDNPERRWKPGMFVTGLITTHEQQVDVLVPLEAIIKFEGQPTVFIQDEHGFEPRVVTLGRQSATQAELLGGLKPGEKYVAKGAFMVKAELGKSEAGHGH